MHRAVVVAGAIGQFQEQRKHRLGHAWRAVGRRVADHDAAGLRRSEIDDVHARRQHADHLDVRQSCDRLGREHGLVGEHDLCLAHARDDVGIGGAIENGGRPKGLDLSPTEITGIGREAVENDDLHAGRVAYRDRRQRIV